MSESQLLLPGLDPQNPLGFLAACGLLRVLDDYAQRQEAVRPRLSFSGDAGMTPELTTSLSISQIIGIVLEDASAQGSNPALTLAYTEDGRRVPTGTAGARRDLKPAPIVAAQVLEQCAVSGRRVADFAAALFSELVQDNNNNTKPTAFHFTAGQQAFLQMVDELRLGVNEDNLREALIGPWLNQSVLPSLSWDSSVTRLYALRASDPSTEKRGSVPAANWLGVQALSFFPVVARNGRLVTTCVEGGWKNSAFRWPIWTAKLTAPVIASLLRMPFARMTAAERAAAGIHTVFSANILRSDQGGYGSFSPADVVLPVRSNSKRSSGA